MKPFSECLWESISADIYPAILEHPFIKGLTSGDLPESSFKHYVCQDSTYLRAFGKGLAILAAKADTPEAFMMFCDHARTTVIVEEALHREFLSHWDDNPEPPAWNEMAPNGLLYSSYLVRTAYEHPFHEALAAFLPCYWIYRRVGNHLVKAGSPNPLYQKWIDTYAGEEFGEVVRQILELTDRVSKTLTDAQRWEMTRHFRKTSELEFLFWDMGYKQQEWPFGAGAR